MADEPPVIEIISDTDDEAVVQNVQRDHGSLHAWVRTLCAVAAVAVLVWIGISAQGQRQAADSELCYFELQTASFGGSGDDAIRERIATRADECGLDLLADSIRSRNGGR